MVFSRKDEFILVLKLLRNSLRRVVELMVAETLGIVGIEQLARQPVAERLYNRKYHLALRGIDSIAVDKVVESIRIALVV